MATINALIEPASRIPRLSTWMKLKRWALTVVEESPLIQTLCCLDASELECYRVDQLVRSSVRDEMRLHMGYTRMETCVASAIQEVLADTGYDLSDGAGIREANQGIKRTLAQWDEYFSGIGVDPRQLEDASGRESNKRPARIVPKFAAACALHIRTKLGTLSSSEANMLLVQRKYLELCRRHRVRDVDVVLHQQFVMNTVFTEGVLDEVATVRRRLPRWIQWLDSIQRAEPLNPSVC
jgi:hypothetical protein